MPALYDLLEQTRRKRRAQLDSILANAQPMQIQMGALDTNLPQSKGSSIIEAFIGDAARAGVNQLASSQPIQASAQTYNPIGTGGSPSAGTPGGAPLSPPAQNQQSGLQNLVDLFKRRLGKP